MKNIEIQVSPDALVNEEDEDGAIGTRGKKKERRKRQSKKQAQMQAL